MTRITVDLVNAFNLFLSSLATANQQPIDPWTLDELYQEKLARLDQSMATLTRLAQAGMEEQLAPLLDTLLQEWAIKEVIELQRYQMVLDPADQTVQDSFWAKLVRQHQALSSELLVLLQQAQEQERKAKEEREHSWQKVAVQWSQDQRQMNQQWFAHQQNLFTQYQQSNREWANAAMTGVQQAQLGVKQWYDFAASTQANVANMLAGTEQRQTTLVDHAIKRANSQKWLTRLIIVGVVILIVLSLFGVAFIALINLY